MKKILLCFGTRPEAIKMAPLYHFLKTKNFEIKVCVTAQHREMLDQVLDFFEIQPDYDLNLMQPNQSLNTLSSKIIAQIDTVLLAENPNLVLVHGDTTTSSMVALAAFHRGIKVGHIEAGLRTYNKQAPFPEELNRQLIGRIADFHFCPTDEAATNLLNEGIKKEAVAMTGNTVIDALFWAITKISNTNYHNSEIDNLKKSIDSTKKVILITGHRRENFGEGFLNLCNALSEIANRNDVQLIYPVHLNPNVKDVVTEKLSNHQNILLVAPVSYPAFVWLMQQSFMIITDSGGIQEEAPSLGKPVLVTRTVSERPEGISAGFSTLVGTDIQLIVAKTNNLLDTFEKFENQNNPYGDGKSSEKIYQYLEINKDLI